MKSKAEKLTKWGLTKGETEAFAAEVRRAFDANQPLLFEVNRTGTRFSAVGPVFLYNDLHWQLTGKPVHDMLKGPMRNVGSRPYLNDTVMKAADKAMRLYGHPSQAVAAMRWQIAILEKDGGAVDPVTHRVLSELALRADGKTEYGSSTLYRGYGSRKNDYNVKTNLARLCPDGPMVEATYEGRTD